jgi:hypothetical protein
MKTSQVPTAGLLVTLSALLQATTGSPINTNEPPALIIAAPEDPAYSPTVIDGQTIYVPIPAPTETTHQPMARQEQRMTNVPMFYDDKVTTSLPSCTINQYVLIPAPVCLTSMSELSLPANCSQTSLGTAFPTRASQALMALDGPKDDPTIKTGMTVPGFYNNQYIQTAIEECKTEGIFYHPIPVDMVRLT